MIWIHWKASRSFLLNDLHIRPGLNYIPWQELCLFVPLGRRKHHPPIWRLYIRFRRWNGKPQVIVDLGKLVWDPRPWLEIGCPEGAYGTETKFALTWPDWGYAAEWKHGS